MKTHGWSETRLHNIWMAVKSRCYCKSHTVFSYYGGRGITICEEWKQFEPFRDWSLQNGYADNLELDRLENTGNYEPSNCQWTTKSQNGRNRRNNVTVEAFGEVKTIADWADDERCAVNYINLRQRIRNYRWEPERAIVTPLTALVNGMRIPRKRRVINGVRWNSMEQM